MRSVSDLPFGLTKKAVLAFLYPFIATLVGVGVTWLTTGAFDGTPIKVAISGLAASALALLGAYVGEPAAVEFDNELPGGIVRGQSTTPS